ncbi:hypothetical protein SteCoe_36594 [Stentor coeruleus]|uniref:C2 domain-containing protein n=1 Tax=Stentor coeruleus TaxID=5963 RepID=A0A1R2AQ05_9CILI|nr:hypothetical protein SteCoe_36594 [Stentor coeruleus]
MNGYQGKTSGSNRLEILEKIFAEVDFNKDKMLSFQEFHNYLSKKSGKEFNEELLGEIFRTIDRDKTSVINLSEFIQGFSKTENIITKQINEIKVRIAENSDNYTNAQRNLVEAKAKNMQNIVENNLFIVVKKAEGLKAGGVTGNKAPMVRIVCDGNSMDTTPVPNPTNPEWNQSFTFPITSGKGNISIEVWDTERGKPTYSLGELAIPLQALANQELHEDLLELKGKNSDKPQGKILISLQWIYDLPMYLEKLINEYEIALKDDKAELEGLETYMKELVSPIKTSQLPEWIKNNQKIEMVERNVSEKVNVIFERTLGGNLRWPKMTLISVYAFLTFSVLAMFIRSDFMNLTVALGGFIFYMKQLDIPLNFRIVTAAIVISQFYDVFWFWNYFHAWVVGGVWYKIALVVSVINFFAKFVFGAVFWKNSIDST